MKMVQVWESRYLPNATTDEIGQQGGNQSGGEGDNVTNKQTTNLHAETLMQLTSKPGDSGDKIANL